MSTEQLVVALEARVRDFERNFQKASGTASREFGQIEKRSREAGKRLEEHMTSSAGRINATLATLGKGGLAALAGTATIAGVTALAQRVGAVAEGIANIGSEARRAGVTTKLFQEWTHVANQTRIPVDALIDGFKELAIRADEFAVTGKGSGEEAFKRLGFSASDLARRLKEPDTLMLEIIRRMGQLDTAAQIRVADEVFGGTGGERFVELLGLGEAGIRSIIEEANSLGLVMDDELIGKADELDRRFKAITATVGTGLKRAVVEIADGLSDVFDGLRAVENQQSETIRSRLGEVFEQRQSIIERIADMERQDSDGFGFFSNANEIKLAQAELAKLTAEAARLKDILDRRNGYTGAITETGTQAADAGPKVKTLAEGVSSLDDAGTTGASGIKTFGDAIRSLKNEIPGLTDQLAELDAKTRIEGAYRSALQKARSIGDTITAERLRDEALASLNSAPAREAAGKGMLDLIGYAEGTDKGRGYNETLAYGAYSGGPRNLVTMTLDEVDAMQSQMLRHPANTFNSSASGRYQIVQKTLRGLRSSLGLSGSELFDPAMQDRLAQELLRQRGNDPAGLRNEWEGLRRIDAGTIRTAYDGTSVAMPAVDEGVAAQRQERADDAERQREAYKGITEDAARFRSEMTLEQQALDMTSMAAAKLRYEQDMLAEAQRAGITLSPAQRQELSQLAQGMAEVEEATRRAATTQGEMRAVQDFMGQSVHGFFSSIVTGSATVEQALQRVVASLADAALEAALLGSGPLASLFGGGGGGGLLSVLGLATGAGAKGFATGGHVRGPGTGTSDSIPARLSNGEFVVNAAATRQHRAVLEAINAGSVPRFPTGGPAGNVGAYVGATTRGTTFAPSISVKVEGGSSGDRSQDEAYAASIADAVNAQMEAKFAEMLQDESRPGGMVSRRRFTA